MPGFARLWKVLSFTCAGPRDSVLRKGSYLMPMEICMERMGQAWDEIVQVDEVLCFCKPERPSMHLLVYG